MAGVRKIIVYPILIGPFRKLRRPIRPARVKRLVRSQNFSTQLRFLGRPSLQITLLVVPK